ncbi:Regulatory protein npr1 [Thalictrum thalictroides]|uniref:Regulatory protein npr1 n=1 Tax=Thalictrum thalictroides TaxID=46969 RepID=A0A7J6W8T2_THATH|nr:Regulatory protein npr1 [Thalictrum thalictroides]
MDQNQDHCLYRGKDAHLTVTMVYEVLQDRRLNDPYIGNGDCPASEIAMGWGMKHALLDWKCTDILVAVGLAKLLFPMEAKVAMDIAQVDGTLEFPLAANSRRSIGGQVTPMDLNETPFKIEEEHLNRMKALSKTVELGKRFFPRCSDVLNKIMDADDLSQLAYLGNDSPEERVVKKRRYVELQDVLVKAFSEDKEELDKSIAISSPSSSSPLALLRSKHMLKSDMK